MKELKGFRRIHLKPGESQRVSFPVTRQLLSYYDAYGQQVFEPGTFDIMIGPNSRDVKKTPLSMQKEIVRPVDSPSANINFTNYPNNFAVSEKSCTFAARNILNLKK